MYHKNTATLPPAIQEAGCMAMAFAGLIDVVTLRGQSFVVVHSLFFHPLCKILHRLSALP